MKCIVRVLFAIYVVANSCAPLKAQLMAGAARVSITPDPKQFSYELGGYVSRERQGHPATGIHDTCYARALVLQQGLTRCAVVSLDLCYMPANIKTAVLGKLNGSGFTTSTLFFSATHTHSAPDPLMMHSGNTVKSGTLPIYDARLTDFVSDRIAQSIKEAVGKLAPAKIGSGQMQHVGLNRNRRGEQVTDDEMTAVKLESLDGKPMALVIVYAAHPVYFGSEMLQVSGDWSGMFQRQLEGLMPGTVALFLNGAEGDASPDKSDEGTNAEKIGVFSAKICLKAITLLDSVNTVTSSGIRMWTASVNMPPVKPNPLFLLASAQLKSNPEMAKAMVNRLMPNTVEVSYCKLGDALLMGVPGEPTTPIGLEAKVMARATGVKHPAIVALTNGWIGYIVSEKQYKAGRYEPTMSFYGDQVGAIILAGVKAGLSKEPKD